MLHVFFVTHALLCMQVETQMSPVAMAYLKTNLFQVMMRQKLDIQIF
jgi:hypothetical protein